MPRSSTNKPARPNFLDELSRRDTPCDKFSCRMRQQCAERELACDAWGYYVATGRAVHPMMQIPERVTMRLQPIMGDRITPTHERFLAAERDERAG
jgi:hypothetical protein